MLKRLINLIRPQAPAIENAPAQKAFVIDIDKDAALILNAGCKAVESILAYRASLDRQGMADRPLIVLAGESHDTPSHHIYLMNILKKMKGRDFIGLSLEQPHNYLKDSMSFLAQENASEIVASLKQENRSGALSLKAYIATAGYDMSPHTIPVFLNYALSSQIPTCFADTAAIFDEDQQVSFLDHNDHSTIESLIHVAGHAAIGLNMLHPDGVWARNHHIMEKTLEFAHEHKLRIIFIKCGHDHVAGSDAVHYEARHSLSSLFNEKGIPSCAMLNAKYLEKNPTAVKALSAKTLFSASLPQLQARYNPQNDQLTQFPAEIQCRADESRYTNALLDRIGLTSACLSVEEYALKREWGRSELRRLYSSRKTDLGLGPS